MVVHNDDVGLPPDHMGMEVGNDGVDNDELGLLPDLMCDSSSSDEEW